MRCWVVIACAAVACKSKEQPPKPVPSGSAVADAAVDWKPHCADVLRGVPKLPATRRVMQVIDGCRPCGDWTPLLKWADPAIGRTAIDEALARCKAFCNGTAKQRWNDSFDDARGTKQRTPWRVLGEVCKGEVSALPDARFVSAPYFALDRIARATAADATLAPLAAALDLPLPPVGLTGSGLELPDAPATTPDAGPAAVTVTQTEIRVARVPRAKLTKDGVAVELGADPYPGALVAPKQLAAALDKLADPVAVFAPKLLPATRLLDITAARGKRALHLAIAAAGVPQGWTLAGTIPVAITAAAPADTTLVLDEDADAPIKAAKEKGAAIGNVAIALGPKATVGGLAKLLGALAYFDVTSAALTTPTARGKVGR